MNLNEGLFNHRLVRLSLCTLEGVRDFRIEYTVESTLTFLLINAALTCIISAASVATRAWLLVVSWFFYFLPLSLGCGYWFS